MGQRDTSQPAAACIRAWQLLRLAHDRVAGRLSADLARECGLTIHEFDVLFYLHSHAGEEVRLNALLSAVPLSQPALSRLVARLTDRGLLARGGTESDGRAVLISLTPAGASLIDHAIAIHTQIVHETLTSKFSDEEQATLLATLSQIGKER